MNSRILIAAFLLMSISLFAQKQTYVSVNVAGVLSTGSSLNLGFGVAYEEQLVKHHGYEFGINLRSLNREAYLTIGGSSWDFNIRESYLNLPISYKFYSNVINFTTGISFDAFLGGKYLTDVPNVEFGDYSIDPKFYVGWNFKLGKEIKLTNQFVLEPEIQYNPIFNYGYSYYGAALKLKYKL